MQSPGFAQQAGQFGFGAQVGGAVGGAFAAYSAAKAAKTNYKFQSDMAAVAARREEYRAVEASRRGSEEIFKLRLREQQVIGAQRARFAAAGVALDEGSALRVLSDTEYISDLDAKTLENNTQREIFMIRETARMRSFDAAALRGASEQISPAGQAAGSLLSSAGQLASSWYRLNPPTPKEPGYTPDMSRRGSYGH